MDLLFTILSFILLISIIVGIHELGHFLVARYFKIHVLRFKIGFGKELFSFKDKKNCTYSFGILPLGGYVQMLGENSLQEEDCRNDNQEIKKSYLDALPGERAAVTVAGPLANFVLAIFIYFYLALVGTTQLSAYVGEIIPSSLIQNSGIEARDKIIEIDSQKVEAFNDINLILSSSK